MIVVRDLKDGDEVMHCHCGSNCEEQFIFKVLEKKKSIKFICPKCGSETHIRHMANGKIRRRWYKGEDKK